MLAFAGECLDSLIISGTSDSYYALYKLAGYSWVTFAGHESATILPNQIGVAALANGKSFWVLGKYLGTDYLVSP